MSPLAAILAASLIGAADVDAAALLARVEAAGTAVQDVYLEYQGQMSFPTKGESDVTDAHGVHRRHVGALIERRDGAFFVDVYGRYARGRVEVNRSTLVILGKRFEAYSRTEDSRGARWPVDEARFGRLQETGSILNVFLRGEVLEKLRKPENYAVVATGEEEVDGSPCLRIDFGVGKKGKWIQRYDIDLNRGGIVLKYESHMDGHLSNRVTILRVAKYEDAKKQPVWIPMEAVRESFIEDARDGAFTYVSEATNRETYGVFPESVRVGTGFKDDRFSAKPRNAAYVTNALKQARYDFDHNAERVRAAEKPAPPPPPLKELVRLAEAEGDALLAPSRERSANAWLSWAPWLVCVGGLLGIVVVTVHSRLGR